jgi:hypothetical protein
MRRGVLLVAALVVGAALPAQQMPDTSFHPVVRRPAWARGGGPRLCLDEGHHNFHTLDNRFLAFGELARGDGYRVSALKAAFTAQSLTACDVLVIGNAQPNDDPWASYPYPTPTAFSPAEVRSLHRWVRRGGALLLLADHMPLAGAAKPLAAAFGVSFTDGFAVEKYGGGDARDSAFSIPTLFRAADGTLGQHAVLRGRDSSETVTQVRSFTGQAFQVQARAAVPLMILAPSFISLEPRVAWEFKPDTPRRAVGGWLQGAAIPVRRGRLAVFGEAGMFSAQLTSGKRAPMGMNAPFAEQNAQFILNVLHWLSGLLGP